MADIVYNYIRVPDRKEGGVAVICTRIHRPSKNAPAPYKYNVSFAFCSSTDNFSKRIAKHICDGRAEAGICLDLVQKEKLSTRQIVKLALNELKLNPILKYPGFINSRFVKRM